MKLEPPDGITYRAACPCKIIFFVRFCFICLACFRKIEYHSLLIGVEANASTPWGRFGEGFSARKKGLLHFSILSLTFFLYLKIICNKKYPLDRGMLIVASYFILQLLHCICSV